MQSAYEKQILSLTTQHEQAIDTLLSEFKRNLQRVQERYEASKRETDGLRMINEEKLTMQEEEQKNEIQSIEEKQRKEIQQLEQIIGELKTDMETLKWQKDRLKKEREIFKKKTEAERMATEKLEQTEQSYLNKIAVLEDVKKDIQKNLKKKETELYSQKFKIKDLQKTKQVLTHRTQEMKASLEPKEQQIESLKEQLLDLEKVFEI